MGDWVTNFVVYIGLDALNPTKIVFCVVPILSHPLWGTRQKPVSDILDSKLSHDGEIAQGMTGLEC